MIPRRTNITRKETNIITINQNISNQNESINKETSPKGDSKSISSGLCSGSKYAKRTQFQSHQTIHFFMQNKPNLPNTQRRIMQNEPNFNLKAPTKHAKEANFTQIIHSLLQLCIRQMPTFTQKFTKNRKNHNFLTLTYLTLYIAKGYTNFCQGMRFALQELRETKKCKTNPISHPTPLPTSRQTGHGPRFMQNEHNLLDAQREKNEKRTQFTHKRP